MAQSFGSPVELTVGEHVVKVSNPEKPYFPAVGITKLEVVQHYLACGDGILRALRDRPTTLERWPGGVVEGARISTREGFKGEAFYQKRVPQGAPSYVETAHITFPSGRTADEIAPNHLAVIAWAAQLGTITFHPWPVRRDDVDHPDELRLDLDPGPGTDFTDAVEVARGAARGARRARHGRLAQDLGQQGRPRLRADRAALGVRRHPPRRDRDRPRARTTDARARHDEVVEGGAAARHGLPRLQPERARPHHRLGVLGAAAGRTRRCRCR